MSPESTDTVRLSYRARIAEWHTRGLKTHLSHFAARCTKAQRSENAPCLWTFREIRSRTVARQGEAE